MLSNPNNNNNLRQHRQHRRQQSTPTTFEPSKVPSLPPSPRRVLHRRGMSLDPRQQQQQQQQPQESVSITNQGLQEYQQHNLREAQQQRLARPGPSYPLQYDSYDNDENYSTPPLISPQRQSFDTSRYSNRTIRGRPAFLQYPGPFDSQIPVTSAAYYSGNSEPSRGQDVATFPAGNEAPFSPSIFLTNFSFDAPSTQNQPSAGSRPSSSRGIGGGIAGRVSRFEDLSTQGLQRPMTPPTQNATSYFPPTPGGSPSKVKVEPEPSSRFDDTSMEETIKPVRGRTNQDVFSEMRQAAETSKMPSPPGTDPMASQPMFESAPDLQPNDNSFNIPNMQSEFPEDHEYASSACSPTSSAFSRELSQPLSSPVMSHAQLYGNTFDHRSSFSSESGMPNMAGSGSMHDISQYSERSDSVCSINLEESITETGITIDDIANFISGPDPNDGKWLCLYQDCNKRFGRKENIKSHVQTHLGDRQFQCPHCKKCFVRQHDLKRHAKIHSGVKPYPCLCGNSFARHDALTRHRQRGMCIGAFEGVVKKVAKRGRPRKARPDVDERQDKSTRTRSRNKSTADSTCSASEYSESSCGASSPRPEFDMLDEQAFDLSDSYSQTPMMPSHGFQYQQPQQPQHCVSPSVIQAQAPHSPSKFDNDSFPTQPQLQRQRHSLISSSSHQQSRPASPASHYNSYNTPPGLCISSVPSPGPSTGPGSGAASTSASASATKYFEIAPDNKMPDLPIPADDDMFMDTFQNSMSALDGDMLMMSKFDEAFCHDGSELFAPTNEDDNVFFGSP